MAIGNGHLILLGPPWKHRECPLSYSKRQGYLSPHWLLFPKGGGMPPGNNFLAGWLQCGGSGTRRAPGRKQEGSAACTWGKVMPACGKWGSLSSKDTDWHSQGGGPQDLVWDRGMCGWRTTVDTAGSFSGGKTLLRQPKAARFSDRPFDATKMYRCWRPMKCFPPKGKYGCHEIMKRNVEEHSLRHAHFQPTLANAVFQIRLLVELFCYFPQVIEFFYNQPVPVVTGPSAVKWILLMNSRV